MTVTGPRGEARRPYGLMVAWCLLLLLASGEAFTAAVPRRRLSLVRRGAATKTMFAGRQLVVAPAVSVMLPRAKTLRRTPRMDFGDGGFLGVGTGEIVVVLIVGYFLLGPTELYRATKQIATVVTQAREFATQATAQLTTALEEQIAVEDISSAARDIQQAFSPLSFSGRQQTINERFGSSVADEPVVAPGPLPDLEAPSVPPQAVSPLGVEDPLAPSGSKFQQQLSGNWNDAVLRGEGPWSNPEDQSVDDLMLELAELEALRQEELDSLKLEFQERTALLEEKYSTEREVVSAFAKRKAALQARVQQMNEELALLEQQEAEPAEEETQDDRPAGSDAEPAPDAEEDAAAVHSAAAKSPGSSAPES